MLKHDTLEALPRRGGTNWHPTRAAPLGLCGVRVTVTQAVGLGWHRAAPSGRNTNMEFVSVSKFQMAQFFPNCSFAAATTPSGVNPNLPSKSFSGADAPNVFMAMIAPVRPV